MQLNKRLSMIDRTCYKQHVPLSKYICAVQLAFQDIHDLQPNLLL